MVLTSTAAQMCQQYKVSKITASFSQTVGVCSEREYAEMLYELLVP